MTVRAKTRYSWVPHLATGFFGVALSTSTNSFASQTANPNKLGRDIHEPSTKFRHNGPVQFETRKKLVIASRSRPSPELFAPDDSRPSLPIQALSGQIQFGTQDYNIGGVAFVFFILSLITVALAVLKRRRSSDQHATRDSQEFTDALKIWHPVVRARVDSPRELKRFINRVRYLAAFHREKTTIPNESREEPRLSDAIIVALAALQCVNFSSPVSDKSLLFAPGLAEVLSETHASAHSCERGVDKWVDETMKSLGTERSAVHDPLCKAISLHRKQFHSRVTKELIERYLVTAAIVIVR